jgi:type VI protein secretion system component VasK
MKAFLFVGALVLAAVVGPVPAFAYVGPGAGLSLIGAFWALILAVLTALFFLVAWPMRRLLRQSRGRTHRAEKRETAQRDNGDDSSSAA